MIAYRRPRRHPWTGRRVYVPLVAAITQVHVPCWCCDWQDPWPHCAPSAMVSAYLAHCAAYHLDLLEVPVYVRYGPRAEWDALVHPSEIVGLVDECDPARTYAIAFDAAGHARSTSAQRRWTDTLPRMDGGAQ